MLLTEQGLAAQWKNKLHEQRLDEEVFAKPGPKTKALFSGEGSVSEGRINDWLSPQFGQGAGASSASYARNLYTFSFGGWVVTPANTGERTVTLELTARSSGNAYSKEVAKIFLKHLVLCV